MHGKRFRPSERFFIMQQQTNEPVRLSKRMAELGLCSRREADS